MVSEESSTRRMDMTVYGLMKSYVSQWVIIPGVLVAIPFIFIKSMKEVAFTSAIGAIATLGVVLIVLISSFQYRPAGPIYHHDVIWDQFPIALSSIAFSYGKRISNNCIYME